MNIYKYAMKMEKDGENYFIIVNLLTKQVWMIIEIYIIR